MRYLTLPALLACACLLAGCEFGMDSSSGVCQVLPSSLDFGSVPVGSSDVESFVIENVGGGTLRGFVEGGSGDYSVTEGVGLFELGGGETRFVSVRFSPSTRGSRLATLDLGTDRCEGVLCSGVGTGPLCVVDPTSLEFGTVPLGDTSERTFTIRNVGEGILRGEVNESYPHFAILSGEGPFHLLFGQVLTVTVQFEPTSLGVHTATVNTGTACAQVACEGEGTEGPECVVSPEQLDFGYVLVGSYSDLSFGIRNIGGGTLFGFVYADCEEFTVISGAGEFYVGSGETHTVVVRFAPTSAGSAYCTVETNTAACSNVLCGGIGFE